MVEDMTTDGRGIIRADGKRIFVDGGISGEQLRFRRLRRHRDHDEAELVGIELASAQRTPPRCRYFGVCGGCSLQHLTPAAQLQLKEKTLLEALARIGRVEPGRLLPAVDGPPWAYRRRARLSVRDVKAKGRVLVGFSERRSPWVTDMASCEVLHEAAASLIQPLSELIGGLSIRRRIPQAEVAVADNATALVLRVLEEPNEEDRALLRAFGAQHSLRLFLQPGGPDSLQALDASATAGALWYELPEYGLRLEFSPTDFIQINAVVNQHLVRLALELLNPDAGMHLLDLYCGIGNFSLPLARHAGALLGVEGEAGMVRRAQANARLNGIDNAEFMQADLSVEKGAERWSERRVDAVLLDPPRAGAAAMLAPLAGRKVPRILYVSCHPGTLARDAGTLVHQHGYRLAAAGVLDMFPSTSHMESIALFEYG